MSGIYDRLQRQLEIRKREEGISPLELRELPPNLRKIMRMMLRAVVMKHSELLKAIDNWPDEERLNQAELDSALGELVRQHWLLRYGQGDLTSFKVNLRRKAGSQLGQDIWSALNDKISTSQGGTPPPEHE